MERTRFNSDDQELKVTAILTKSNQILIRIDLPEKNQGVGSRKKYRQRYIINTKTLSVVNTNKKTTTDPSKKSTAKDRNIKYFPLAKFLYEIISSNKNIKYDLQHVKTWANEIRILSEKNGIDYERIKRVLDWYSDNIGGEYIPIVESGYSLRMKFARLEGAIMRQDFHNTPESITDHGIKYTKGKDGYYRDAGGNVYFP